MAEELNGQIYDRKNEWGGNIRHDFTLPNELTVTITLNEYRSLVEGNSKAKVTEAQNENYKLRNEIESLKKKIEVLNSMIRGDEDNA